VGEKGAETVFIGTEQGLVVAGWDGDRSQLDGTVTVDGIAGPVQAISGATPDGTVFVAPESGLWAVRPDGTATPVPAMEGVRVGAVDVVADRLYAGTAEGARSAPVDSATTTRNFDAVRLVPADLGSGGTAPDAQSGPAPDVTAIWAFDGRPWFGTSNRGLMTVTGGEVDFCRTASTAGTSTDPSAVEADADRNPPPVGTVIRSGLATGGRAFVLATSEGVYDAQPVPSDGAGGCDLRFARRATSDANVAVEAGSFDNVATAPDGATSDDVAAQPVWSGADRSLDLIWWPGTNGPGGDADGGGDGDGDGDDSGGALGRVDGLVTSRFDGSTALDNSKVRALTTVGSGDGRTLLIGTDYGIWYHTPGRTDPRFRVDRIRALDESGNQVGEVVDCTETTATDDGTSCTDAEFDHRARTLEVELGIRSVGNPNGYQFVVTNAGGPPTLEQRRFTVPTDRGRTESLQLTALDEHLAQSRPLDVELRVRQRTPWQWFTETSAKWVAAVILTAAIALVVGYQVVRTVKRHGRRKLRDAEVAVQPATEDDSVTVTVGAATDRRMVDVEAVRKLWDQLRADKDPERILEIGDALHDGLLSPNAARELGRAGLGTHDLRLRLRGLDAELDALPWEALRTTSGSLVARQRTSIVRDLRPLSEEPGATPSAVESVAFPVRILVVVAQPGDMAPIAGVEEEIASIEKAAATRYRALLRTRFRARSLGTVEVLRRAGPASFRAAVSEGEGFDFVHVIAHGERTGRGSRIWLEDEDGDAVRMEADELVDLFAGHSKGRRRVRMVVLNTCSSADDGDAAPGEAAAGMAVALVQRAGLPAAVGMSMKIRTPAATTFCDAFYRTLFRHGQVDYAMYEARWKIGESDADWLAPRLYVGSAEAELYGDD
jgi:CHAT domain-containing protein